MSDVVNLRRFRKRRQRAEKERAAEANRISHGRTRAERSLTTALNDAERRRHEAGRIDRTSSPDEPDAE